MADIATATPSTASTASPEVMTSQTPPSNVPKTGSDTAAPTTEQVNEAIRKFKLKLNGQEQEFDLGNEEHLSVIQRMAQKGESADRKFNEAAMMRKQNEEFIRLLKTNPEAVLSNPTIGLDVKEWAEKFLWQRLQEERMSPEQKKAAEMARELEEYRQREMLTKEKEERAIFEKQKAEYKGRLESDIIKTLEVSGLPKSPRTVARIAHYMLEAKARGWSDVSPSDVVDTVWKEYIDEHNQFYGLLPTEKLKSILSPELRKKFRELEMADVRTPGKVVTKDEQPPSNPERQKPKKGLTIEEWKERNRRMMEESD
jgi:uncharacterized protein YeeX (DUF496 family)